MAYRPRDDDNSNKRQRLSDDDDPSEVEILRLVAQRESLRQSRRFAESDSIREELRSMGVELFDKEKEWRCRDGRRGHLFTAGPGECPFSDSEIQERINLREDARKAKDWRQADSLRDELRANGVEINDRDGTWRTSSGRSGTYGAGPGPNNLRACGPTHSSLGVPAIRKLVAERERLRASMDFEAADELRRQLAGLGVELFDNERVWRSSDGHQGVILTGGHEVDCLLSDSDISHRVQQREDARSAKDFSKADMIRDELRRQGVELLDAQKSWCTTDGRQGSYSGGPLHSTAMMQPIMPMGGGIGNALSQVAGLIQQTAVGASRLPASAVTNNPSMMTFSTASIAALVTGRERAREHHDWDAADAIRADLRSHGVDVWDKEKVWRSNDGRSGPLAKLT